MSRITHLLLAVTVVFLSGCDARTKKLAISDPRVAPMLQAMAAVDRAALGFAPIPTNATALLLSCPVAGYDAMLNIFDTPALNAGVHRTIGFRKTATGYKCILEQEIHPGPKTFTQSGHTAHEWILITYETERLTGRPLGKAEATSLIEKALLDQAGIVTTRLDDKRASVTYNDALPITAANSPARNAKSGN